jgi:hypothetical protein
MGVALEGEGGGSVPGEGLEMPYGLQGCAFRTLDRLSGAVPVQDAVGR